MIRQENTIMVDDMKLSQNLNNMWPFTKKQEPIWKLISKDFLRSQMIPCYGAGGEGSDVDTFNIYALTYEDILTGKKKIEESHELVW